MCQDAKDKKQKPTRNATVSAVTKTIAPKDSIPADKLTDSEKELLAVLALSEDYPLEDFIALVDRMVENANKR